MLHLFKGRTTRTALVRLIRVLYEQMGTPQNPVDWTDPDQWIPDRLSGENRALAQYIWTNSGKTVNPRYLDGSHMLKLVHQFLKPDTNDIYQLTVTGEGFLANDPATVRKVDHTEGIPQLLGILARHSPAKRGDLLEEWGEFLLANSKFGTPSTIKDTLRRRIRNVVERGLVAREGNTYTITDEGIAYAVDPAQPAEEEPYRAVQRAIKAYNDDQIQALRERLGKMNPYRFESLVKDLLEAMDYEDVEVTKQSGDKGIDVVAHFQFGITRIKEVVQVKRHQGSITRPVLDQLRGTLPYHQAIRGTIITLGRFAKGCEDAALYPGAAPITLIDGGKLMELLLKHGVGIKERKQTLIEVDDAYFAENESPAEPSSSNNGILELAAEEVA